MQQYRLGQVVPATFHARLTQAVQHECSVVLATLKPLLQALLNRFQDSKDVQEVFRGLSTCHSCSHWRCCWCYCCSWGAGAPEHLRASLPYVQGCTLNNTALHACVCHTTCVCKATHSISRGSSAVTTGFPSSSGRPGNSTTPALPARNETNKHLKCNASASMRPFSRRPHTSTGRKMISKGAADRCLRQRR